MSDILETMLAAVPDSYQKTVGFPIYDILAAAAIRMGGTEELLAHIKAMLDPDNLTGDDLDAYIYPRTGQVRNAATKAVGVLTVTGTGTINAGDLFESEGGIQFEATETVDITDSGTVAIRCTTAGTLGNLPAGSVTMMPVQLAGTTRRRTPPIMPGFWNAFRRRPPAATCTTTAAGRWRCPAWALSRSILLDTGTTPWTW